MAGAKKSVLDKDLKKIGRLEAATRQAGIQAAKLGVGLLFLLGVFFYVTGNQAITSGNVLVIVAALFGGYMALNIGANDVANNMSPAVGARALTMFGALVIAAIFETAGALLAGGDVVSTISKGIIDTSAVTDPQVFIWVMLGALLAAAVWVNLATYVGAPVSTTHAVVGGVLGAGMAAANLSAVHWPVMAKIAASWVISPLMGGIIAAFFLWSIKKLVIYQDDRVAAARRWVPVFVAVMASAFSMYLVMKGLKRIWKAEAATILTIGAVAFIIGWALVHAAVRRAAVTLENSRKSVGSLFIIPLIFAAAMLSFAHGANDVANAVGPVAAVVRAAATGDVAAKAPVPVWVMMVGALGISAGLALFGPKLIRTVGEKITKLDPARAFAVALAAAITVLIASALGLPVSSTHTAVGAIFGVGFLREALSRRQHLLRPAARFTETVLGADAGARPLLTRDERKALKKLRKRRLVRRYHFYSIIAAWLITVPLAAVLGAMFFYMLRGMLLP